MSIAMRPVFIALALFLAWSAAGCASRAKPDAMTVLTTPLTQRSSSDITVTVIGGKETASSGTPQISDADFAQALSDSFSKTGLFAKVSQSGPAKYALEAFLVRLEQPLFGFSFTVTLEVSYALSRSEPKEVLWKKSITTTHTATTGDAFIAVTRLRLATEGAAKNNIEQAIREISNLKLE